MKGMVIKMSDKVSVVLAAYNAAPFIKKSIDSVLTQSYKNFELIIIDDGSTDDTPDICNEYALKDSRIRVISTQNNGVSSARNLGIRQCSGKYIIFIDADDYMENIIIEQYIYAMQMWEEQKVELAFVMCGMQVDALVGTMENKSNVHEGKEKYVVFDRNKIAYLCWLSLFNFVTNKMYSVEAIKNNNIYFSDDVKNAEDLEFNIEYLEKISGKMGMVNMPLYHYVRRSENSLSLKYYPNAIEDTKYIYHKLIRFALKQDNVTEDDMLVIKSIYLFDWVSRVTVLYSDHNVYKSFIYRNRRANAELQLEEFHILLNEVYACKKISTLRYMALKTQRFAFFYCLRYFYRIFKKIYKHIFHK